MWVEPRAKEEPRSRFRCPPRGSRRGIVSPLRVLVVDDEPQILRALQTSLRAAGYEVETAADAAGALMAAGSHPPDAVILDLVLPDGTGTDVARHLREWTSAPILVLSVVGDEREKVAALDAGADDYVTKPFSVEELLARLRRLCAGRLPPPTLFWRWATSGSTWRSERSGRRAARWR